MVGCFLGCFHVKPSKRAPHVCVCVCFFFEGTLFGAGLRFKGTPNSFKTKPCWGNPYFDPHPYTPRSFSREDRIRVPIFSVAYLCFRGTLPTKKGGHKLAPPPTHLAGGPRPDVPRISEAQRLRPGPSLFLSAKSMKRSASSSVKGSPMVIST